MKVNIGLSSHNSRKFPHQSVDVNTTSDFGFMQPMSGCIELAPKSTLILQHRGFVRFHAMVAPTFGRVTQRTYHYFVPIADIWHPFENFLSGRPYNGVISSYIPENIPSVTPAILQLFLTKYSYASVYSCSITSDGTNINNLVQLIGPDETNYKTNFKDYANDSYNFIRELWNSNDERTFENISPIPVNPENADIIWRIDETHIMCCMLTNTGRNIRKVFIGLGYKPSFQDFNVSILPLFAYFKAYFDHWYPQRDITWKDTVAFKFMECCEQYNRYNWDGYVQQSIAGWFSDFIELLSKCYYYQNPDYFSSQFIGPVNNNLRDNVDIPSSSGPRTPVGQIDTTSLPTLRNTVTNVLSTSVTSPRLKALDFLTKYVNKKSIIGGKIDNWLRTIFGADYIQEDNSYYIGEDYFDVDLSEVMSTAGTSETLLGEYAGQGKGYSSGKKFKVHATTFGFYINMSTVVPLSRFNQGSSPVLNHIKKFDFYHPDLDGITLVPTPKSNLLCDAQHNIFSVGNLSNSFGFAPIYQEYKLIPQNILNGDMSLNSTRDTYRRN